MVKMLASAAIKDHIPTRPRYGSCHSFFGSVNNSDPELIREVLTRISNPDLGDVLHPKAVGGFSP
jgi:hypothetical protein